MLLGPEDISGTATFESDTNYRLTPGVYPPLSLDGVSNVTIQADQGVLVTGSGRNGFSVTLWRCARVTLDGLSCVGPDNSGIGVYHSQDVTIRRGRFVRGKNFGIFASFCLRLVIEDNVCGANGSENGRHGIYISNSPGPNDNHVIRRNVLLGNADSGIQLNADKWSDGSDGVMDGCLIEGNVTSGNRKGINLDGVVDTLLTGNVWGDSVRVFRGDGAVPSDVRIVGDYIQKIGGTSYALMVNDGAHVDLVKSTVVGLGNNAFAIGVRDEDNFDSTLTEQECVIISDTKDAPIGGGKFGGQATEAPNSTFHRLP